MKFGGKRVYLACGPTDMRKQINGLSAKVQTDFAQDPFRRVVARFPWLSNAWCSSGYVTKCHSSSFDMVV